MRRAMRYAPIRHPQPLARAWHAAVCALALAVFAAAASHSAAAQATPDTPGAIVVYPYVVIDSSTDTLIQLTNTSEVPVEARCFYEDLTPDCQGGQAGESCLPLPSTCSGPCLKRQNRVPFRIRLTPRQPLAWHASSGLHAFPLDGSVDHSGPDGSSNAYSDVPGLGTEALVGTLRCVTVGLDPLRPSADNSLIGLATIEHFSLSQADAAQYRAVGLQATPALNQDEFLQLGGPTAEYEACPYVSVLEHFFDGATVSAGDAPADVSTTLVLTPCSALLTPQSDTTVEFLVTNEFSQRFSTSKRLSAGQMVTPISNIDTGSSTRSIFHVGVSGTLVGQTTLRAVPGNGITAGLHVVAVESHQERGTPGRIHSDAFNGQWFAGNPNGDVLAYRPPRCIGDCNLDGQVFVDEIIAAVNLAMGTLPLERCSAVDANRDGSVTVDEIVSAINRAFDGCPQPLAPMFPEVTPGPTPPGPTPTALPSPTSPGPQITVLGLSTADDRPLLADTTDDAGRPVFVRPYGQGMTLLIEARPGLSGAGFEGPSTYSPNGLLPDLQLLVSRPLGNGDPSVCEADGTRGGVPATPTLQFTDAAATIAAINDLGCRAYDRAGHPQNSACARGGVAGQYGFVVAASRTQFCVPIARAWSFPQGDTIVAARARDANGNLGAVEEMVVRVLPAP